MHSRLVPACKPSRIALALLLTWLLSGWTCSALFRFDSCFDAVPQPQVTSLWPDTMSANASSALLNVSGSGFVSQSQILWNGNPLQTTFVDSLHLQTTITQQTLELFGGSSGRNVLISVMSPGSAHVRGCSNGGASGTLVLGID
jgi:hypothetical protein